MSKSVYLAGPISGCSYDGCTTWRDHATARLAESGIAAYTPLRFKDFLEGMELIEHSYPDHPLATEKGITTRDRWDTSRVDVVLMNLTGCGDRVSIGTMIEAGWADMLRKPVVVCMQKDNIHNHPMLNHIAGYILDDLDSGIKIVKALLTQ